MLEENVAKYGYTVRRNDSMSTRLASHLLLRMVLQEQEEDYWQSMAHLQKELGCPLRLPVLLLSSPKVLPVFRV